MSDDSIPIVPSDPRWVPSAERAEALIALVSRMMPGADEVAVETTDEIVLVDAGSNQGPLRCPRCGAELDHRWWAAATAESHAASAFTDRRIVVPCCVVEASKRLDSWSRSTKARTR